MARFYSALFLLPVLALAACDAAVEPVAAALTKDQASALDGRGTAGDDLCLAHGWYDDGVCDAFCVLPDADCGGECPDPSDRRVRYFGDAAQCSMILFACEEGETGFSDSCGCGCIATAPSACPDPADPHVRYLGDAAQCSMIYFMCEEGETPFSDDCGCGCIGGEPPVSECPDPTSPRVHYVAGSDVDPSACDTILFTCDDDQTHFVSAECGCGCIDAAPSACPDPEDPRVHYVADSDQNPDACLAIFFACSEGQTPFSDECGCGCIDGE